MTTAGYDSLPSMAPSEALPDDINALKAALLAERARADAAQADLAIARAERSDVDALVVHPAHKLDELLPWSWRPPVQQVAA